MFIKLCLLQVYFYFMLILSIILQWTNIDIESNVVINLIWLLQLCLINVHASGIM